MKKAISLLTPLLLMLTAFSANAQSWWSDSAESDAARLAKSRSIVPDQYRVVDIDLEKLITELADAPRWFTPEAALGGVELTFPMPDGSEQTFQVVEAPVMSPGLAAKYPGMRSFAGKSRADGSAYARFGYTHKGFHAMILSGQHSTVFIDVYSSGQTRFHQVYYKSDYSGIAGNDFVCHVDALAEEASADGNTNAESLILGDCLLRDYRMALACTGEYAQFHGGTVPDVMAEYNVAMTRVNGVYERDVTVHMELIDRTDELIFLNGNTDPYTNNNGATMLGENQATIDDIIGFNDYDIGHVFSTGGGGIASLNAPCNGNKARGVTGLGSPVNDPFYIDYVAHEIGHQFGANHTQNNSCNRVNATAMEPGSASTIMGYAGICAPNVQNNSDDHFHAISIQEITNNIEFGSGGTCPEIINTGNTGPMVSVESTVYNLPVATPFFLTAIATDSEGDEMTYCWEQMDNEIADMPPLPTNDGGPAFRSNSPTLSPTRYFPNLQAVVNNADPEWEVLPAVSRDMDFRCTVRDNVMGGGCTSSIDVSLAFSENAGPFEVLTPNTSVTWLVGEEEMITWDVANTDAAPVSCSEVDIYLSTDGGLTYPILLASNVPNNGSTTITVPLELTNEARVQVVCSDNIFYDISNEDFTIEEPPTPNFLLAVNPGQVSQCNDVDASFELQTTVIAGFDETLTFSVNGLPEGAMATFTPNPAEVGEVVTLVVSDFENAAPGTYTLEIEATSTSVTQNLSVSLELYTGAPEIASLTSPASGSQMITLDSTLSWAASLQANEYLIEIATSPEFGSTIVESATVSSASYQPTSLEEFTIYYWRVTAANLCGSTMPSDVFSFQTIKNNCQQYTNDDPGLVIPDNGTGMYSSTLEIPDDLQIVDVNFSMDMAHTWVGDLTAVLTSPSGTTITLFEQPGVPGSDFGCGENNLLVDFDDEATNTADAFENSCEGSGAYAIEGSFQPIEALSNFDGESAAGVWTLDIFDSFDQDGGSLTSWSLEFCVASITVNAAEQVVNMPLEVFRGRSGTIGSDLLAHEKTGFSAAELSYRIVELPDNGILLLAPGQDTLSVGATFTQEDIDMGSLAYKHDSTTTTTDLFLFDLSDPEGGWLAGQTFNILIVEPAALSATTEITSSILCDGGSEGSIEVVAAGGIPPYQYSIDNMSFQSSPVFDNLSEGSYTITIMDDTGMTFEAESVNLVAPSPITGMGTAMNGTITVDADGGTSPYTYSLDGENYQDSNIFAGLDNDTYLIQVQDANGCAGTIMIEVNSILSAEVNTTAATCAETMDGSIDVGAISGGAMPYTYQLNGGTAQSTTVFNNLAAGLYDLLITGANGNTLLLEDVEVGAPDPLQLLATTPSNGITLNAEGGTPPYEYSIDGGMTFSTTTEYSDLANGDYEVVVRDANGCTDESTLSVSFIGMANVMVTAVSCAGDTNGAINVNSVDGGLAPYTYSLNGGENQSEAVFADLAPGSYDLLITDADGNTLLMEGLMVGEPDPLAITAEVSGSDLTLNGTGGTAPYEYSIDGGMVFSSDAEYADLANGMYDLVIQDANGCTTQSTTTINNLIAADFEVINISCAGDNNGSIQVQSIEGGTMPYMYSLNGGEHQTESFFEGLGEGTYEIVITDANGNTLLLEGIMVNEPAPLVLNPQVMDNDLTMQGEGGTLPYQYSINGGGSYSTVAQYDDLPNGTYNLAILDANGCTYFTTVNINPLASAEVEVNNVNCAEDTNGVITITQILGGVQPFTFSLNGGTPQSEPVFTGLSAGTYELEITDAEGASIQITNITITEPDPLQVSTDVTGNTLMIEGEGGTAPYEYSIDGGQTFTMGGTFSDLPNGDYDVVVMDSNGCTTASTATVNIILNVSVNATDLSCFDAQDGSIEVLEIEGGAAPYTYQLNEGPEQMEGLFEGLPPGEYSLEVEDANGNTFVVDGLMIISPTPVVFTNTVTENNISIMASGGTEPYQYSIDGGANFSSEPLFTGLENGDYGLQVMDANGCLSEVETVTIVINSTNNLPFGWSVQLAPNPTNGKLWLEGKGLPGAEIRWQLVSPLGQKLLSGMAPTLGGNCQVELSLANLPAGTYWIWLRSEDGKGGALPVVKQ